MRLILEVVIAGWAVMVTMLLVVRIINRLESAPHARPVLPAIDALTAERMEETAKKNLDPYRTSAVVLPNPEVFGEPKEKFALWLDELESRDGYPLTVDVVAALRALHHENKILKLRVDRLEDREGGRYRGSPPDPKNYPMIDD